MWRNGGMGRRSFDAETRNMPTAMTSTVAPAIAVFLFHAAGAGHQPPDGDQTFKHQEHNVSEGKHVSFDNIQRIGELDAYKSYQYANTI